MWTVSAASAAGEEAATTPAPAWTRAVPAETKPERMTMQVSSSPSPRMYPTEPP